MPIIDLITTTPLTSTVIANPQLPNNENINIKSRIYGLFIPPVAATYTFYLSSGDSTQIYLNPDSMSANLSTPIINFESSTELKQQFTDPATISDEIYLSLPSYLEIWYSIQNPNSHFSLGIIISPAFSNNLAPSVCEISVYPAELLREYQIITISGSTYPTGGSIIFQYGVTMLNPIPWDNNTNQWPCLLIVREFLSLNIGNFLCSVQTNITALVYNITFNFPLIAPRNQIMVITSSILPNGIKASVSRQKGSYGLSGYFSFILANNGQTDPLPCGMNIKELELYLNEFYPILQNQLMVQGSASGDGLDYWFYIPFYIYNLPSLQSESGLFIIMNTTQLVGGNIQNSIHQSTDLICTYQYHSSPNDGTYFPIIPSDFLTTFESEPQVTVKINGINAICRGDCSFLYKIEATPTVSNFELSSGILTISGERFSSPATIEFSYSECWILCPYCELNWRICNYWN